jgi:hypothetical protein
MVAWLLIGPGVLAMLGENDGPSMLSYAVSGSTYRIGFFLPFIAVTFAAAYVVQEMSMRLGAVTHRGYGELIFQRFGRFWGWVSAGDLFVTNLIWLRGHRTIHIPPAFKASCSGLYRDFELRIAELFECLEGLAIIRIDALVPACLSLSGDVEGLFAGS